MQPVPSMDESFQQAMREIAPQNDPFLAWQEQMFRAAYMNGGMAPAPTSHLPVVMAPPPSAYIVPSTPSFGPPPYQSYISNNSTGKLFIVRPEERQRTPSPAPPPPREQVGANTTEDKKSAKSKIPVVETEEEITKKLFARPSVRNLFKGNVADMRRAVAALTEDERDNMDTLLSFAKYFKTSRLELSLTQRECGSALGARYGMDFSQTTVSRFEALNLSYKNMCKLRPLLEQWLRSVQVGAGFISDDQIVANIAAPIDEEEMLSGIPRRRKKRTQLDPTQKEHLQQMFEENNRPSQNRLDEISNCLGLERDVVRVWFSNRRQKTRKLDEERDIPVVIPGLECKTETYSSDDEFNVEDDEDLFVGKKRARRDDHGGSDEAGPSRLFGGN